MANFLNLTISSICIFIRPTGLVTLAAFTAYIFYLVLNKNKLNRFIKYLIIPSMVFIALLSNKMFQYYGIMESLQSGTIICGIESLEPSDNPPQIRLEIKSVLLQLLFFMIDNPIYFLQLSFDKMLSFWSTYRSGYSILHNISSILFFLPVYLLAIWACWKSNIPKRIKIYLYTFIGLTCFLVMITCVNWDSRFLSPALPFVFVLAGLGFGHIVRTFNVRVFT